MKTIRVHDLSIGDGSLVVIAGPCVIENGDHAFWMAQRLKDICNRLHVPFIFKSSFDKANRSSIDSYRGPGEKEGLAILSDIRKKLGVPIISDIHTPEQAQHASDVLDIIQIPAFLCRQTDLLCAAARTKKVVNVKKGQFMAPNDMKNIVHKLESCGCKRIMLTERGASFGYRTLVSDMRSLPILRSLGYPVIFDATHSVQQPGGLGKSSGGQREFVPVLARSAVAAGVDAVFLEVHDDPDRALCDGPNMLALTNFEKLIEELLELDRIARKWK